MSTRSNTIIKDLKNPDSIVYLYRHFDGYLDGAGFDILNYVNIIINKNVKLDAVSVGEWIVNNGAGYEYTTDIHGDIEYLYIVELNGDKPIYVRANETVGKDVENDVTVELENAYLDKYGILPYDSAEVSKIENKPVLMHTKEELHKFIDEIDETRASAILDFLKSVVK